MDDSSIIVFDEKAPDMVIAPETQEAPGDAWFYALVSFLIWIPLPVVLVASVIQKIGLK